MKKILLPFIALLVSSMSVLAGEMTWYNEGESLLGMPARVEAASGDTAVFYPKVAQCVYYPDTVVGSYHVALCFFASPSATFPQMQFHMRIQDTLRIADTETAQPMGLIYAPDSVTRLYATSNFKISLEFISYDTLDNNGQKVVYPKYKFVAAGQMNDGTLFGTYYNSYFYYFINYNTRTQFFPSHEQIATAVSTLQQDAVGIRKIMRNGRILIERTTNDGVQYYDLQGRKVEE